MDHFSYSWWYIRLLKRGKIERERAKEIIRVSTEIIPFLVTMVISFFIALAIFIALFYIYNAFQP